MTPPRPPACFSYRPPARLLPLVALLVLSLGTLLTVRDTAAQTTAPPSGEPGMQVITAEEIEQAGLTRLSDLFGLLDDWYAVSTEGFAWQASANGLSAIQEASWLLMIDDQPVYPGILDTQNINLLALGLDEIDYVEVHNTPAMVSGVFAQAGVLHLHTRRPAQGPALQAEFSAGNEVGDPGPYRYTAFSSPNIDRIGPTLQGNAAYGGGAWFARARFKADEHHATDQQLRERVLALYQGEKAPRLLLTAGGVDAGLAGRLGRHALQTGFSRLQDLRFFEPLGREAPTDHYFYHVGLGGAFWPGEPTGISYRLSYTVNDLDPRNNRGDLDFNWRQNALRAHYEVRSATPQLQGALGFSYDRIQGYTGVPLADPTLILPRAYGRLAYTASPRVYPTLTAYLTRVKGAIGFGALATAHAYPAPHHRLTLTGSFARQPYAEQGRLWYWVSRGYAFFSLRGLDVRLPTQFAASTTYTADLAWRYQPSNRFSLTLSGALRRFDDLTLPRYRFTYDSLSTGFHTVTDVRGRVYGRVLKAGAEVHVRLVPALEQRLSYAYERYPTTEDTFYEAWRNQPWHRFSYQVRYVPLPRLSVFGRLSYRSETEWPAFHEAADASGRYQALLPAFWLLDLSAQKRLWRDHIDLSLSLRNALTQPYRTHPAGAITNMVFQVRIQVYLHKGEDPE